MPDPREFGALSGACTVCVCVSTSETLHVCPCCIAFNRLLGNSCEHGLAQEPEKLLLIPISYIFFFLVDWEAVCPDYIRTTVPTGGV